MDKEEFFVNEDVSILVSTRVVFSDRIAAATIIVDGDTGKILGVYPWVIPQSAFPLTAGYYNYSPYVLMPGLVDTHVHFNEPGRTNTEGFFTGTQAALSGGVTTIIDMPLNSIPPTTTMAGFKTKIQVARNQCWTDVGFLGGIVPGNVKELKPMMNAGARGFKCFLIETGVPEFPCVSYSDVRDAMIELADSATMLLFHAEKPPTAIPDLERLEGGPEFLYPEGENEPLYIYDNFLASRPPVFEDGAIKMLIDLSIYAPKLPLHIAHVSTAEALPILRQAQIAGANISAETCFHYLSLSSDEVPMRDTRFKSEPPIRSKANQDQLWGALRRLAKDEKDSTMNGDPPKKDLRRGPITTVVSDHSPCSPAAKFLPSFIPPHQKPETYHDDELSAESGDFFRAWGGIASVGLGLPILWTQFKKRKWNIGPDDGKEGDGDDGTDSDAAHFALQHIVEWTCRNTAELVGLGARKGRLETGFDADVCVFDPEAEWVLTGEDLLFKHKMSPYEGRKFNGQVRATWLRGKLSWQLGTGFVSDKPEGKLLLEKRRPEGPDPEPDPPNGWMGWAYDAMFWPLNACTTFVSWKEL